MSDWPQKRETLLRELARIGRLATAAVLADVSLRTVRRQIVMDAKRLGAEHPDALGSQLAVARAKHRVAARAKRLAGARRRAAQAEALREERYSDRGRAGAEARWAGRR